MSLTILIYYQPFFIIHTISFLIGEKISDSIQNWLPKETNIQKFARIRKSIDWLYQDPEDVPKTRENNTVQNMSIIPTHRSVKLLEHKPSAEMIHVLYSLNMSTLHEQSQQFKYSTIGDVGTILWGSSSNTKTIDFKSKLAENGNSTAINITNSNVIKPKIFKRMQKVIQPKINVTERTAMAIECERERNNTFVTDTILSTTENFVASTERESSQMAEEHLTATIGAIYNNSSTITT